MVNRINHHNGAAGTECSKLCCTKIKNFAVSIGNMSVFSGVNLHIHCGQLTAVIGPNGAGKSTLLRAILGEIAHSGELQYVDAKGNHTGNPIIGYVPQHLRFDVSSPTSVLDLFMASLTRRPVWLCRAGRLECEHGNQRAGNACNEGQGLAARKCFVFIMDLHAIGCMNCR